VVSLLINPPVIKFTRALSSLVSLRSRYPLALDLLLRPGRFYRLIVLQSLCVVYQKLPEPAGIRLADGFGEIHPGPYQGGSGE
jgi:hypothetical protein